MTVQFFGTRGTIAAATFDPDRIRLNLRAIAEVEFQKAVDALALKKPQRRPYTEALAHWAAGEIVDGKPNESFGPAYYYFVNLNLPHLVEIITRAALRISVREAIEQLPNLEPKGRLGLRSDEERDEWRLFGEMAASRGATRQSVIDEVASELTRYLDRMKDKPGRRSKADRDRAAYALRAQRQRQYADSGNKPRVAETKAKADVIAAYPELRAPKTFATAMSRGRQLAEKAPNKTRR